MRIAAHVFLAYGLVLVLACVWFRLPVVGRAAPDVVALMAVYLGLTARHRLAPATLGAVIIGYLGDLLLGSPRGLLALAAGIMCIFGHLVHKRLIVRGRAVTLVFSATVALVSATVVLALRAYVGISSPSFGADLRALLAGTIVTTVAGPVVFRLCRMVDARFARTHRERDAALEGFAP